MSEHEEQVLLFQWADRMVALNIIPELKLLYAVPNGAKRPKRKNPKTGRWYSPAGQYLQAEGVKKGIPDVVLPVARKGWHGLYIEMKFDRNKPTDDQKWWLDMLTEQGYLATACWSFDEAKDVILDYMEVRVDASY